MTERYSDFWVDTKHTRSNWNAMNSNVGHVGGWMDTTIEDKCWIYAMKVPKRL